MAAAPLPALSTDSSWQTWLAVDAMEQGAIAVLGVEASKRLVGGIPPPAPAGVGGERERGSKIEKKKLM